MTTCHPSIPKGAAILITGCDTGFGNGAAQALAKKGYSVYAGCYSESGKKALEALGFDNLSPVVMDVTKEADIVAVAKLIEKEHPQGL